ncbi:MAG TPA: YraN family protein [Acidimicrobiales bacterium]|nr:YraN family protein [Acidimicrobiales bacterium]
MTDRRRRVGIEGEELAAAWYRAAGYQVLDRNWRCRDGELDLVCGLGRTVVFCEVKARRSAAFGEPEEAVTAAKRRRIRRLAARWLAARAVPADEVRFDVAAVSAGRVRVVTAAF